MDSDKRGRACGIDRHARAMQSEKVGHPTRSRVQSIPCIEVAVKRGGALVTGDGADVVVRRYADDHAGGGLCYCLTRLTGALESFPSDFEEQPMLRIKCERFAARQAEERIVELLDIVEETAS